jgi:hypothetical protein
MGFLVAGIAFIAGLLIARHYTEKPLVRAAPAPQARVGSTPGYAPPPKAQPGDAVAVFPYGQWGVVHEVTSGADGGYRYVVGFANGATVELRGREITAGR